MERKLKNFQLKRIEEEVNKSLNRDYINLKAIGPYRVKECDDMGNCVDYFIQDKLKSYVKLLQNQEIKVQLPKQIYDNILYGGNVCMIGFGSALPLFQRIKIFFPRRIICRFNGHLPSFTEKNLFKKFGQLLVALKLAKTIEKTIMKDQLKEFRQILQKSTKTILVLFDSIDKFQTISSYRKISQLFSLPKVQLVCSISRIKIVMYWPFDVLSNFGFSFYSINQQYTPHFQLLKYHRPDEESKKNDGKSLASVWKCLSPIQKTIMKFIARNELKQLQKEKKDHYTLSDLLQICIDEIVLSNDMELRQNLIQITEHKVVLEKFDEERNKKVFYMSYDKILLTNIVEDNIV